MTNSLSALKADGTFHCYDHLADAPDRWPSSWKWISTARQNAIGLFPCIVYKQTRVDHSVFGQQLVVISDPSAIRHICGTAAAKYRLSNLHLRLLRPALGNGLIVAEGKSWALQRRLAVRLTHSPSTSDQIRLSRERIDDMIDGWLARSSDHSFILDPLEDLIALSLDLIAIHAFSHSGGVASDEVLRAITIHRRTIEKFDLLDVVGATPSLTSFKMTTAARIAHGLDHSINSMIASAPPTQGPEDIRHNTCAASRDFVVSMMAGFESTTLNTLWLLGILAAQPTLANQILAERSDIFHEATWQESSLRRTSLLGKCVLEALRLYPPLPLIYRTATTDDQTPAGVIKKGALVCMSPWIVHRHDELWEKPAEFHWQRFDGLTKLPDGYMPFGIGARQCVGMLIGRRLVETVVRRILERCSLSLFNSQLPSPRAGVSLRPSAPMRFTVARH